MYLITNRKLGKGKGLKAFGKTPNPKGPNELRLVRVDREGGLWNVEPVEDRLTSQAVKKLKRQYNLDIDTSAPWYASLQVACELFEQACREQKSILFFVHGYNNDVADVLAAAEAIEKLYKVIVVPFTWPANGGGAVSGTAAYLSDKSDARVSAGALDRAVGKIQEYHLMLTRAMQEKYRKKARGMHKNNPQARDAAYTRMLERKCFVRISLLCHSMGNYVFKYTLKTGENMTSQLVFDNICLVAADVNNEAHAEWVGKLDVRKRIYIVINENDSALLASRIKPGQEQKARLGHYLKRLDSPNATYVNVTDADHVGGEHTYFKGDAVAGNRDLLAMFDGMFNGAPVEDMLEWHPENNTWVLD